MPIEGPVLEAPFPLAELLTAGLDSGPDNPAVITRFETLSWAQLYVQSELVAKHYVGLGLSPGERVATLMPNRPSLIIHHLACLKAGLCPHRSTTATPRPRSTTHSR